MVITRIEPLSCGKIAGVLYAFMGLVAGAVVSLVAMVGGFGQSQTAGAMGALFGVGAVILLPVFYGVLGLVIAVVTAWIFNVAAGLVGGIEVQTR
jgi:hypothetical protein